MPRSRNLLRLGVFALALCAATLSAIGCSSQASYPTKAIELVVALAPGGGSDLTARINAKYLSAEFGVPVNVTNKAGGNLVPGTMSVMSAAPDGYTLLSDGGSSSSSHAQVKDLPYKWDERTFGPMMAVAPMVFVVYGKSPLNSLKDVVDAAKKDPGSFTWSYLGGASFTDYLTWEFLGAAGIDPAKTKPVSFTGSGPAITAIAGDHLLLGSAGVAAVLPLAKSGDIKVLAINSSKRVPVLPDVPTTGELGFPTLETIQVWHGISGPKGLPKNVLDRINQAAKKITADPAYQNDQVGVGNEPRYLSPDEQRQRVIKEADMLRALLAKYQK